VGSSEGRLGTTLTGGPTCQWGGEMKREKREGGGGARVRPGCCWAGLPRAGPVRLTFHFFLFGSFSSLFSDLFYNFLI
jgi:hypothetical protein